MTRKPKFVLPDCLKLPNEKSKDATAASTNVDLHYEQLGIWARWTLERFNRLCRFLNLTPEELASVACIPHSSLARLRRDNHLYVNREKDRSGALVLTLIEASVLDGYSTDLIDDPIPNIAELSSSDAGAN